MPKDDGRTRAIYARRERLKAAGLCVQCGKYPRCKTNLTCPCCRDKNKENDRQSKLLIVADGRCGRCREPRGEDGTKVYCRACARRQVERQVRHYRRRRDAGECICCKGPLGADSTWRCRECLDRYNELSARRAGKAGAA